MKAIADILGVARSNLAVRAACSPIKLKRRGRKVLAEYEVLAEIQAVIAEMPSYGYRRVHAIIGQMREAEGRPPVNVKRVYRIMKCHRLLLTRHTGAGAERRCDGRVAVDSSNTRWCSDGFEIGCVSGERVRIAFTLDCRDREAIAWVATTGGISGGDVRDLMVESVERRYGLVDAENDADRKPAEQRHGRSFQNLQARLCQGEPKARCQCRPASARPMVRALQ
jgi:putative transposase